VSKSEKLKTEEELAAIAEKRRESGRRLQEQAAKRRIEKVCIKYHYELVACSHTSYFQLLEKERDLEHDLSIKAWKSEESQASFIVSHPACSHRS